MQKVTCLVSAHYYENSNIEQPNWNAKGSVKFKFMVNPEDVFHAEEIFVKSIIELLQGLSNVKVRYTYSSYELLFHDFIDLEGYEFKFNELLEKCY